MNRCSQSIITGRLRCFLEMNIWNKHPEMFLRICSTMGYNHPWSSAGEKVIMYGVNKFQIQANSHLGKQLIIQSRIDLIAWVLQIIKPCEWCIKFAKDSHISRVSIKILSRKGFFITNALAKDSKRVQMMKCMSFTNSRELEVSSISNRKVNQKLIVKKQGKSRWNRNRKLQQCGVRLHHEDGWK